jgi:multimeric flavodoxin WrbA
MKILVINGSPKIENSNTMKLTQAFLDGSGFTDIETVDVKKLGIKACTGCYACWNTTPGKCVLDDCMAEVLAKLIAADVIIWSFPLYYFSVPGGLKTLIDRQLPLVLPFMSNEKESGTHPTRYETEHQRHVVISTCGFWTAEGNYNSVVPMFDHFLGEGNYAKLFCGQGELFRVPELKARTDQYLEIVSDAGREFSLGGISDQTQVALAEPLYPRIVFEKFADASWNIPEHDNEGENVQKDDSLNFTTQMAALYRPDGVERVLEINYTDIGKTYQILLTKQGSEVITDGFKPYTTRIETPYSVWRSISRGEITGQEAMFQKQYSVLGDFSLMLRWDELFGSVAPIKKTVEQSVRKANMFVLLMPWIVIWTAIALNPMIGSILGIIAAVSVPLLWLVFRPVLFERISILVVAGFSLAALLGAEIRLIVPASYLAFGLMWIIGTFPKTPLTAYYSAVNYGNDKAFANPLFIRTNRILTAAWGVLYLITPIWTYMIMGTSLSAYIGLINSAVPALMGLFTVWFQKWYPARWAKK